MNWFQILVDAILNFFSTAAGQAISERAEGQSANTDSVYLFHGTFSSELEATDYCLNSKSKIGSESFAAGLPNATVDTAEVELIFGMQRISAVVPMLTPHPAALLAQIGADNTLVMISEAGLGELPHTLQDTPKLRYAGPYTVT